MPIDSGTSEFLAGLGGGVQGYVGLKRTQEQARQFDKGLELDRRRLSQMDRQMSQDDRRLDQSDRHLGQQDRVVDIRQQLATLEDEMTRAANERTQGEYDEDMADRRGQTLGRIMDDLHTAQVASGLNADEFYATPEGMHTANTLLGKFKILDPAIQRLREEGRAPKNVRMVEVSPGQFALAGELDGERVFVSRDGKRVAETADDPVMTFSGRDFDAMLAVQRAGARGGVDAYTREQLASYGMDPDAAAQDPDGTVAAGIAQRGADTAPPSEVARRPDPRVAAGSVNGDVPVASPGGGAAAPRPAPTAREQAGRNPDVVRAVNRTRQLTDMGVTSETAFRSGQEEAGGVNSFTAQDRAAKFNSADANVRQAEGTAEAERDTPAGMVRDKAALNSYYADTAQQVMNTVFAGEDMANPEGMFDFKPADTLQRRENEDEASWQQRVGTTVLDQSQRIWSVVRGNPELREALGVDSSAAFVRLPPEAHQRLARLAVLSLEEDTIRKVGPFQDTDSAARRSLTPEGLLKLLGEDREIASRVRDPAGNRGNTPGIRRTLGDALDSLLGD